MVTSTERRIHEKETLRQDILDAAREIFVHEGYDGLTMRRVAEKIGYSPTTIYLYFENKADLLLALCQETFVKLLRAFEALRGEGLDPLLSLKTGLRIYVDFGLRHPQHYLATFVIPYERGTPEEIACHLDPKSAGMQAFAFLRQSVEECIEKGQLAAVDVEETSRALWAGVHGITSLLIVHPDFPWGDRDRVIDLVIESMVEGLRK